MFKISDLKPTDEILVFDTLYNETRPTLYTVRDFINAYKERPEGFGKAFMVVHSWPNLDKETLPKIKKFLDDMLSESGFFMTKTDVEVDCSWTIHAYKEETK